MTEADPVVDICMLTWNTRDITTHALRRLFAADQGVPYRVLLRDNGSTDGTAAAVATEFPHVVLDAAPDNIGFARGVNALLARSSAPYVLVLNGDAWPEAGALSRLVAAARGRPHIGAVAPLLLDPSGAFERSTWPWPSLRLSLLYATGLRRLVPRPLAERWLLENAWQHDSPRAVGWAIGAALLVSREVLTSVGGLDERFFMYGEDVEWCWRMHDAGYRIWFEPAAVVRHVGGASAEQRFAGDVTARKAIASAEVMRLRRGALVAWLWRMLESITAARVWVQARHRRDSAGMHWARSVLQAHLRPRCVGE